ncbi:tRNA uridine-5-carboxymethylaminomethyl(34) synthesis GTPase MnmE [Tropicimonas sp. IMCC34043]|uniref:tRNA uridine-5-carboxymethylaminomethyl(34) synthesis GTPase MnmE n=1 Tax=Tropicimonas sp. IMCC34043 TaxID=2248760 RepID=UPI000E23EE06|nr:tRNA uridine-5-carboxymethylaminomethyl(34) synthesis GTPase MnmE [Tropicimonas sp. IMCC34043]
MDTIFALATAPGRAGVAVVRVSGPAAWTACEALAGRLPRPRLASLCRLHEGGELIDEALVLVFESGSSFTGDPVVEFQTHGSVAVVNRLLAALSRIDGLRPAEAGEFTRRALENERLDLARVEGLADLIEAETEAQRRQAMRLFEGDLGKRVEDWRARLLRAAALVEAGIDFADEEIPQDIWPEVAALVQRLIADFSAEIAGIGTAERLRHGFEVAIVGAPNVGKSTLLNRLAGREAAITSEFAGTTRDVIEVRMDLGGLPVTLLDTAGLRETEDVIEAIGVTRARERAEAADLRLFLGGEDLGISLQAGDILVAPKADLQPGGGGLRVSGRTGEGVDALLAEIQRELSDRLGATQTAVRLRHGEALVRAVTALDSATELLYMPEDVAELIAEQIRQAIRAVDSLVGRIGVEDVLGEIFASFCIGK